MAAPAYTTDLVDIAIGSITVDPGTWDESSDAAWDDAGSMVDDGNLYYNGIACVSAQFTKDGVGTIMYEHTSAVTIPTDGAVLIHSMWAAPPALALLTDGGVRPIVGNGFGVFSAWKANGADTHKGSIWTQYAIDPSQTADYPDVGGAVSSPYDTFGMAISATAQARGNPNAVNAIRYGRCEQIYIEGDLANGYCNFAGYASLDDATKLGLLKIVEGGYKHQGLHSCGTATTAADFRDTSVKIVLEDTINTSANFNRFEVTHADTRQDWTDVSIQALGTHSRGQYEIMTSGATVNHNLCAFTDVSTFKYGSGATVTNTTFRRAEQVSQLSGVFTNVTFDKPSGSVGLLADSLNSVTDCIFNSDGTGHGVDLGTFAADTSVTWDNTDTGYTASSSGDEAILVSVATGVTLTINVADGASTPSVYNTGAGTVTVVSSKSKTFTGLPTNTEVRVRQGSYTLYHIQNVTAGSAVFSYTPDNDKPAVAQFTLPGYVFNPIDILLDGVNQSLPVTYKLDPSYI